MKNKTQQQAKEIALLLAQGKVINNANPFGNNRILKLNTFSELLEIKKNCTIIIRQLRHELTNN